LRKISKKVFCFLSLSFLFFQGVLCSDFPEPSEGQDFVLTDMEEQLRKYSSSEYGTFSVNYLDGYTIVQDSFKDNCVRRFYDEEKQLVRREVWKIASSSDSSKLEYTEEFFYGVHSDSDNPKKKPEKCITKNFKEKYLLETIFDDRALKVVETKYSVEDEKDFSDEKKSKSFLEEKNTWKYDQNKRVIENEKTTYPRNGRKNTQKSIFVYKIEDEEPDFTFYENGSIRLMRVYSQPGEYTETAYFDKGFSVESLFKHGIKVSVLQKLNGRVVNRIEYENR